MSRASVERDMLARLGLPEEAGPEEIEAAYSDLVAFLESAPHDLRSWAKTNIAAADEAYAILSDPSASTAPFHSLAPGVETPAGAVKPPKSNAPRARAQNLQAPAVPVKRWRRLGPVARLAIALGALLGTLAVGYVVYASDVPKVPGLTGTPAPESTAAALDTARIATLMQTIQADPSNVAALQELADIYFNAGDYTTSADWENKILVINPDDVTAHLALGAAEYNLGDSINAESNWRRVLVLDPQNVEAHYDLGFMYFSADPPDVAQTIAEWQQVVAIAPDSQIAQTVSTHLTTLEEWQSSAAPGTSAAPASVAPGSSAAVAPAAAPTPRATFAQPPASAGQ